MTQAKWIMLFFLPFFNLFYFINRTFNCQPGQVGLLLAHLFLLLKSHHLSNEELSMVTIGMNKPIIQDKIV